MAIPSQTTVLNTLFSTTSEISAPQSAVNMLTSTPLLDFLYRNGAAGMKSGGTRVGVGVRYGFNPGSQWYQHADILDMTPFESNTMAYYDWKQLHLPVTYTGQEKRENRGEAQMLDLVEEKIGATRLTARKVVDAAMAGDGLGNDGKMILGLEALFPAAPTADPSVGAIGGITAVANPWWQNSSVTSFGSWAANGPDGTATDLFLDAFNTVSDGSDTPKMILSSQDVFQFYHRSALSNAQIIMNSNSTGDLHFATLSYAGVPWYWSRNIAPGTIYMFRPDDLFFWVHEEGNFKLSEFRRSWNQDLYGASMLLMCVFGARRRVFGMTITGITA